jgi:hypothetical protein
VAPLVDLLEKNLAYPLSKGKTAKFNRKLHGFLTPWGQKTPTY